MARTASGQGFRPGRIPGRIRGRVNPGTDPQKGKETASSPSSSPFGKAVRTEKPGDGEIFLRRPVGRWGISALSP